MTIGMARELGVGSLPELEARIDSLSMSPGWVVREPPLLWKETRSRFLPARWKYAEAKDLMVHAAQALGTDKAERRNFLLRNPVAGNDFATLRTLVCAYQTMLPGEKAISHRHAPHAMRVLLESNGAYSVVNGLKHPMNSGDIVLTPGGAWHGHGHEGSEQAFWLDGLDVPLTHLLEPMYYEPFPVEMEAVTGVAEHSPMRFPWDQTLQRLAHAAGNGGEHFGTRIQLDTSCMPTITLEVMQWKKRWVSRPYRHTANAIFVVMRGCGESSVADATFAWQFGDVFAAPAWSRMQHTAADDSVVCCISDRQLMELAAYYRFEALA